MPAAGGRYTSRHASLVAILVVRFEFLTVYFATLCPGDYLLLRDHKVAQLRFYSISGLEGSDDDDEASDVDAGDAGDAGDDE